MLADMRRDTRAHTCIVAERAVDAILVLLQ